MIDERLLDENYYLKYLSMFMKGSFGIKERLQTYVDILNNINDLSDTIFKRFDIFCINSGSQDYFEYNNISPTGTTDEMLERIAAIYGITRSFRITYTDLEDVLGEGTSEVSEDITLNNRELLCLIQAKIVTNNFNGTNEELLNIYSGINGDKFRLKKLGLKYANGDNPLECDIYFTEFNTYLDNNKNIIKMYLAGMLTIEQLGIMYTRHCISNIFIGLFDDTDQTHIYFDGNPIYSGSSTSVAVFGD